MKLRCVIAVLASFVYQVQGSCENPLGMADGRIKNTQITSPSVRSNSHKAHHARRGHSTTWCSAARRFSYIQVNLGREHVIRAITLEGGGFQTLMWVTKYTISYRNGGAWKWYEEDGKKKVLEGVRRFNKIKKSSLNDVTADAIRVHPQNVHGVSHSSSKIEHACLKLELFGCPAAECRQLSGPVHGQLHGISTKHPAKATFSCDLGYKVNGSSTLTCQADGRWDGLPPTCHVVDCGRLLAPSNGRKIVETRTTYNGTAEFACDLGHELAGPPVRRCQANGQWSGANAVCQPVSCGDPGTPRHSSRESRHGFNYGDTIRYRCSADHVMIGSAIIVCQGNKVWNASIPKCLAPCPNPGNPNFGQRHGDNFQHGRKVSFQCARNYVISGHSVIQCKEGEWSGLTPRCMAPCNYPGKPKHGKNLGTNYRHGRTVRFRCAAGYKIEGVHNITCSNSKWNGKKPRCVSQCPNPVVPANGIQVWASELGRIRTVKFKCRPGYTLVGSAVIRCVGTRWGPTLPQCRASCVNPGFPRNGRRYGQKFTHGQAVRFACDPNYKLEGDALISCSNGTWSRPTPRCRASCARPGAPRNGRRIGDDFTHGQAVRFACDPNYKLQGDSLISCSDGTWSGPTPRCRASCTNPGAPRNGKRIGKHFTHGQSVRFTCDPNYKLVGASLITCIDGKWSQPKPRCRASCSNPGVPRNGKIIGKDFTHGQSVRFACKLSYKLEGESSITCSDGTWSNKAPLCRASCPNTGFPRNGRRIGNDFIHGQSVRFACDPNYKLVGASLITCSDGKWSQPNPRCRASCANPGVPRNGKRVGNDFTHGQSVRFACDPNFRLEGDSLITCSDGKWSQPMPRCKATLCPDVPRLTNGAASRRRVRGQEQVHFRCNTGYQLSGPAVIRCIGGQWQGSLPSCNDLDECSLGAGGCDVNAWCVNTDGSFNCRCREGFFSGDGKTCQDYDECQTGTHWCHNNATCTNSIGSYVCRCKIGFTGDGRKCTAPNQGCQSPPIPHGARLMTKGPTSAGEAYALFICKTGFNMVGVPFIRCSKTRGWTPVYFRCIAKSCGDPGTPANGRKIGRLYQVHKVVRYSCKTGFVLKGPTRRQCMENGTWTGNLPTCTPVDCGSLPTPMFGEQIVETGTSFGGKIVFRCRRRGYELSGSRTRICQRNSRWSGSPTRCSPVKCIDPGTPQHGSRVINTGLIYGGYIDYHCDVGYTLDGWRRIFCQANRKWIAPAPTCKSSE